MKRERLYGWVLAASAAACSIPALGASSDNADTSLPPIPDALAPHRLRVPDEVAPGIGKPIDCKQRIAALPPVRSPYAPHTVVAAPPPRWSADRAKAPIGKISENEQSEAVADECSK